MGRQDCFKIANKSLLILITNCSFYINITYFEMNHFFSSFQLSPNIYSTYNIYSIFTFDLYIFPSIDLECFNNNPSTKIFELYRCIIYKEQKTDFTIRIDAHRQPFEYRKHFKFRTTSFKRHN